MHVDSRASGFQLLWGKCAYLEQIMFKVHGLQEIIVWVSSIENAARLLLPARQIRVPWCPLIFVLLFVNKCVINDYNRQGPRCWQWSLNLHFILGFLRCFIICGLLWLSLWCWAGGKSPIIQQATGGKQWVSEVTEPAKEKEERYAPGNWTAKSNFHSTSAS
jgi:hypothetical protein